MKDNDRNRAGDPHDENTESGRNASSGAGGRNDQRDSGLPGGGAGRRDTVGKSGVYPASAGPENVPDDAEVRTMAGWGQGDRGAAGYNDSGGSELVEEDGQLLGGYGIGPNGAPVIDNQNSGASNQSAQGNQGNQGGQSASGGGSSGGARSGASQSGSQSASQSGSHSGSQHSGSQQGSSQSGGSKNNR